METKQPKGLWLMFFVELWERFAFYGMRAIFVLYMVRELMLGKESAAKIYAWYLGLVYFTPLLGGYLADRYLGARKSIFIGCLLCIAGYFMVAVKSMPVFYTALGLIIMGNGFFKPNMTSTIGRMYHKGDPRRDGGYTLFYMSVNIGAMISPILCGYLAEKVNWAYGFNLAAVGMVIGTIIYVWGQNKYLGDIGKIPCYKPNTTNGEKCDTPLTKEEKQRIAVIFILIFFTFFFRAAFEQAGSSLTFFADEETNRNIFGWEMPASWFQVLNPFYVVIFAPIFSKFWIGLARTKVNPSAPMKFAWGLFLTGIGFVVLIFGAKLVMSSGPVGIWWLVFVYLLHTWGELCIQPVGISAVSKLAPLKFASLMFGVWYLGGFFANLTSGLFASNYEAMKHDTFFLYPAVICIIGAVALVLIVPLLKKWMHGADETHA